MSGLVNIYCDESCHLPNDGQSAMVLGAVWCPLEKTREIAIRLRDIKREHGLNPAFELKWSKVSPSKITYFIDVINYFFDNQDLHFRAIVVPEKSVRKPSDCDHDDWFYDLYFELLKAILDPHKRHRIYIDMKDTRGTQRIAKLHDVLCQSVLDFRGTIVHSVQQIRSHEAEQLQLADLLIGCMSYINRELTGSAAKQAIVDRVVARSGYTLRKTTLLKEQKFNIYLWQPREKKG